MRGSRSIAEDPYRPVGTRAWSSENHWKASIDVDEPVEPNDVGVTVSDRRQDETPIRRPGNASLDERDAVSEVGDLAPSPG